MLITQPAALNPLQIARNLTLKVRQIIAAGEAILRVFHLIASPAILTAKGGDRILSSPLFPRAHHHLTV